MEFFEDFLDLLPPSAKKQRMGPQPMNNFQPKKEPKEEQIDFKREEKGTGYAEKHAKKEDERMMAQTLNLPGTSSSSSVIKIEDSDEEEENLIKEDPELPVLDVYSRYCFNLTPPVLPILEKRKEILDAIESNSVIVLTALTGTGKSSQVPQYILERAKREGKECNIIVTQPRRIAAKTIAERVAFERKCEVGTLVGYQIGLDKQMDTKTNSDTRILYCTTGVLLQKLINLKSMKNFTHVILDEVHERNIDMDMLLIIVRHFFATKNPYIKIILMSATLNAEKIANYFKNVNQPAPILDLNIKRQHLVHVSYLDDLTQRNVSELLDMDHPGISNQMYQQAAQTMSFVIKEAHRRSQGQSQPSFLVFLPGIHEITRFKSELDKHKSFGTFQVNILHSLISTEDCKKIFDTKIENKIILATNLAESSVTLAGVQFVIDFCLTKYKQTDTATNMTQLKLDWASKMSLKQRAGRVGRTEFGQVVRLLTKAQYGALAVETIPEILRASLESVVLQAKQLEMGRPSKVLALALDPPPKNAINDSILVLKEIGGLTRLRKVQTEEGKTWKIGKFFAEDGDVTLAGAVMARLPVDVRISKLIILGHMFSCFDECIIIGAGLASRSIFKMTTHSVQDKMNEYEKRLEYAMGTGSDAITILKIYKLWREELDKGLSGKVEKIWCNSQNLDLKNLKDMHALVEDINNRLSRFNMEAHDYRFPSDDKICTIKICIAGAFYPNYYVFGGKSPNREDYRELNGLNPCSTVYMTGATRRNGLNQIYEQQIRQQLCDAGVSDELKEMKVHFDSNSEKLQIEFKPFGDDVFELVPGEVHLEVYKAVKLQMLASNQKKLKIKVMQSQVELKYVQDEDLAKFNAVRNRYELKKKTFKSTLKNYSVYPTTDQEAVKGEVTHIASCGKFFFQPEKGKENMAKFVNALDGALVNMTSLDEAIKDTLLLVKYDNKLMRGKIVEVPDDERAAFAVHLIDYGSIVLIGFKSFYVAKNDSNDSHKKVLKCAFEMPPQCFECRLSGIIPSAINSPTGWTKKSTMEFEKFIEDKSVEVTVNSFVDRIASVFLNALPAPPLTCERLNDQLVMLGLAQECDDPYMCRYNQVQKNLTQFHDLEDECFDNFMPETPEHLLRHNVELRGPFSTLKTNVYSLCQGTNHDISIESSSVNSVLIDPYPNDGIEKVLIATSMSKRDSRITLHQTTIMPHLRGMACLLGLIFSPISEVRCSKAKDRYTSILTGLGCDGNRKPHYGEHDCLIKVDVELTDEDFKMINELRQLMSDMMTIKPNTDIKKDVKKIPLQGKATKLLLRIFKQERSPLGINMGSDNWVWNLPAKIVCESKEIYPPLVSVDRLLPMSTSTRSNLKDQAKILEQKAKSNARDENIKCNLCEEYIETIVDLQLHVKTMMHVKRLMRIRDETA